MKPETVTVVIHGYPVKCEWRADGNVVYRCPWYECPFQTSYFCENDDVECRLSAYLEMHEHLKEHLTGQAEKSSESESL